MPSFQRADGRTFDQTRPIKIQRGFTNAPGSVLISAGGTVVLCTASVVNDVPGWMKKEADPDAPPKGWLTAEYRMLPGSTKNRKPRQDRPDGRATEIQRLIGRSLRAVFDAEALGPRTVYLDCDVLQADGGTRTLSVSGACVALIDALNSIRGELPDPGVYPLRDSVAAVSVGLVDDAPLLDLCYVEDFAAQVDMNVVATGGGKFVEIQGTGEEATFDDAQLAALLALAKKGTAAITALQREALAESWPF
ncbi:MAG: ribonuclease PH [Thermoguttaceae bacterium]|nr:ribonuclease PH [Thermoguttaceae bacterium]